MLSLRWSSLSFRLPASLLMSYIPDWTVTVVSTLVWMYLGVTEPHYQRFSVDDKSISYPYVKPEDQTVTVPMLFFISIVVPAAIITIFTLGIRRSAHDLLVGLLGLLMGVSLTLMFTNGLKNVVGRPRPNLLARCLPTPPKDPLHDPPQGLSSIDICTQTDISVLNEGFRSFPSGHTSLSFAGMTYLTLFLAGKLHIFDRQGHTYKSFVVFTPLLVAAVVGATRVSDYWHHPSDVVAGAVIGLFTATFSYFQYYPILISTRCDQPYDPRKPAVPVLPLHVATPHLENDHVIDLPSRSEERNISSNNNSTSPLLQNP